MEESIFGFYVLLLILGGLIALIGIFIFIFKKRAGDNDIELFSFKFRISDASLVIVVMGCLLMIIAGVNVGNSHNKTDVANAGNEQPQNPNHSGDYTNYTNDNNIRTDVTKVNEPKITPTNVSTNYSVTDVFEIKFTAGVTQYRCALITFNDGTGKMRVKYYSDDKGSVMVEEHMQIENTEYGYRLAGYKPVYPGTQERFPDYYPDNLYIAQDENGNFSVTNIDDQGVSAKSFIRNIQGYSQQQQFLNEFNWELK